MIGKTMSSAQRRRATRRAVRLEARVTSALWEDEVMLAVTNLTPQGLWLESDLPLGAGDALTLSFAAPQAAPQHIEADAQVIRVSLVPRCETCGVSAGMGVRFTRISREDQLALQRALHGLPPPLPASATCACASGALRGPSASGDPSWSEPGLMSAILGGSRRVRAAEQRV